MFLQKKKCMNNLDQNSHSSNSLAKSPFFKRFLMLGQFFLIIFVYHILKDLKDTLVITSSDAGAEVIPFIKIWIILPFAILTSYLFSKLYNRFGREKTLYFFATSLLSAYVLFAFCLFPFRNELSLNHLADYLSMYLPSGCKGFVAMTCFWIYSFFYLAAELWSMIILTVLFWGYVNDVTSMEQAKSFYPLCIFVGNCAGILSGQTSRFLCQTLMDYVTWQETLQLMVLIVLICGLGIMGITRMLTVYNPPLAAPKTIKTSHSLTFKESILSILQSRPLLCIAVLVIGFGLTSNLIEVVWKDSIKKVYSLPHQYNAYVNQLTSIIGILAVIMSLVSRWFFHKFSWSKVALITPILLFITSLMFFIALKSPLDHLKPFSSFFNVHPFYFVMTLGSLYYVLALTAKYTIFDMCKEMAFLSIEPQERMEQNRSSIV